MIKMVLRDFYFTRKQAFREGWKQTGIISSIGVWFVFNFMVSVWLNGDEGNMSVEIVLATEAMVFWCSFLLHAMYPNYLTKPMFLVPADKDEKKEYLKTAYMLKGLTMSGVQILAMLIFVPWRQMLPEYAVLSVFSFFLLNLLMGLENYYGQFHLLTPEGSIGAYKMEWCTRWFSAAVFVLLIAGGVGGLGQKFFRVCFVGVVIQAILCLCIVRKRFREQMEQALDWEKSQYRKGEK